MRAKLIATLFATALLPLAASGQESSPGALQGDAEAGQVKGYTCTGCHGIPGYKNVYPTYSVPKVAGQNADYIQTVLKAYRAGDREHPTMNLQSMSLSDQDIADIAAWMQAMGGGEDAS
jgi:cytochrome c553